MQDDDLRSSVTLSHGLEKPIWQASEATAAMKLALDGMTAVITGASSGIGAATATAMAESGARVLAVGRDPERLARVAATSGLIEPLAANLAEDQELDVVAEAVRKSGGRVDALVHAAGHFEGATLEQTSPSMFDALWRIHVRVPLFLTQGLLPHLRPRASIIFYSSLVAHVGFAPYAAYTAAKGGVEALARSLAAELAPGIRVNTIVPGFTATPMMTNQFDVVAGLEETIRRKTPLGFIGSPEHCAAMSVLLCSEQGSYISGQSIVIDGGWKNQGFQP